MSAMSQVKVQPQSPVGHIMINWGDMIQSLTFQSDDGKTVTVNRSGRKNILTYHTHTDGHVTVTNRSGERHTVKRWQPFVAVSKAGVVYYHPEI